MCKCINCEFLNEVCWCTNLMIDVLDYAEDEITPPECPLNAGLEYE